MSIIKWNSVGERVFEAGVDRGVLYIEGKAGVPWNGLLSVSDDPVDGTNTAYYIDGVKYLSESSNEEFSAKIEAYTYPDEFAACDGTDYDGGLGYDNQEREEFNFTYRTLVGNDIRGIAYGYKIHLVYNALAEPTSRVSSSLQDDPEATPFSWNVTTTPELIPGKKPTAHLVVDSTRSTRTTMRYIEEILYGTAKTPPSMITPAQIKAIYDDPPVIMKIIHKPDTGLSPLVEDAWGDLLKNNVIDGLFTIPEGSRLKETTRPGLYKLEK